MRYGMVIMNDERTHNDEVHNLYAAANIVT